MKSKKRYCIPCDDTTNANPCKACGAETEKWPLDVEDDRDEAYERAAAKARGNDFAETGGRDWT